MLPAVPQAGCLAPDAKCQIRSASSATSLRGQTETVTCGRPSLMTAEISARSSARHDELLSALHTSTLTPPASISPSTNTSWQSANSGSKRSYSSRPSRLKKTPTESPVMIAASEMEPGRRTPAALRDWPSAALPASVGRRVAENFAARPFERPTGFAIQRVYTADRSLDETIRQLLHDGFIPSFCTSCYRLNRTGEHFMEFAIPGFIQRLCTPNALTTLQVIPEFGRLVCKSKTGAYHLFELRIPVRKVSVEPRATPKKTEEVEPVKKVEPPPAPAASEPNSVPQPQPLEGKP